MRKIKVRKANFLPLTKLANDVVRLVNFEISDFQ